ncbi:GxxExxY protein [Carboxylicivirga linearis]|uniref:GxxExxY protein n=1 Tax=Carboxylicivirga linearis TaxID=1628157 RepID=A0ABS5JUS9_9BACT|nr:GxxExxY protein [Carboxylicivirga linearis]MBS2098555.1 GxxExxY protein [Carboxylicivirga linearis]
MPNLLNNDFPLKQETYAIIGAAMEVHKELGCGFLENVYQEAFEHELKIKGITYHREEKLEIQYKDLTHTKHYYADFICFDSVIIELKALSELTGEHESQVYPV